MHAYKTWGFKNILWTVQKKGGMTVNFDLNKSKWIKLDWTNGQLGWFSGPCLGPNDQAWSRQCQRGGRENLAWWTVVRTGGMVSDGRNLTKEIGRYWRWMPEAVPVKKGGGGLFIERCSLKKGLIHVYLQLGQIWGRSGHISHKFFFFIFL